MIKRAIIVALIICWYILIRHTFVQKVTEAMPNAADAVWWFGWVAALPVTFLSIIVPYIIIEFIKGDF